MPGTRPNVVVIGAGFGGIEAAKALRRAPVDVTVVDRQNHHCFQPLLYQVATAALSPADIAWPIRHILRGQDNATVLLAEVTGRRHRRPARSAHRRGAAALRLSRRRDRLDPFLFRPRRMGGVRAGPQAHRRCDAHSPQHPAWPSSGPKLAHDAAERQRLLTFVLVGGGATGVEMAGAIAEIARLTLGAGFPPHRSALGAHHPDRGGAAHPADTGAGAFGLRRHARSTRMGVEVRTSTRVTACDRRGVDLEGGRIDAGTVIWAAGVHALAGRALARRRGRSRRARRRRRRTCRCPATPKYSSSATPRPSTTQPGVWRRASRRRPSRWAAMSAS